MLKFLNEDRLLDTPGIGKNIIFAEVIKKYSDDNYLFTAVASLARYSILDIEESPKYIDKTMRCLTRIK